MLSRFPILKQHLSNGEYKGHYKDAIMQLDRNLGTFTFIAGPPSSGKSALSRSVASAVMGSTKVDNDTAVPRASKARNGELVLWVAPSHLLVDEALEHLRAGNRTKTVVRLYPMVHELGNLLQLSPEVPDEIHLPKLGEYAGESGLRDFTVSRNKQVFDMHSTTAACHVDSVSAHIRQDMESDTTMYPELRESQKLFDSDPRSWEKQKMRYNEVARRAIVRFLLHQADAVVGTPHALSEAASHFPPNSNRPGLIVVDECTRLSEAESLMVSSHFIGTWTLQVGDPQHSGAVCEPLGDPEFPNMFGKQRSMSLLKRAIACGAAVIELKNSQANEDFPRRRLW